ncbi:hypothetical protein J437_LFUL000860, partial [Ladona fulva]
MTFYQANDYCSGFEAYSYLWLEDREMFMKQFLSYGRQLTPEEADLVNLGDSLAPPISPPTMDHFKEQIDHYECLCQEIEKIQQLVVFKGWFQVDIGPFKQALLNTANRWGHMFKQHLVDHVTISLSDLSHFIREADEGLLKPLVEGDYQGLVEVMGLLMEVKDRATPSAVTGSDDLFEPIHNTIELLKYYDVELPEEVHVVLHELPEQWSNTKRIAMITKQQVAPLQATEVTRIRKKISLFDTCQSLYREKFKKSAFLKFNCERPYALLDATNCDLQLLEGEMKKIQESASLFEVNVSEFKQLKQCCKELRMLKQLWDYVHIVQTSIEDWKLTPWRKIDVENMDIECKKFAKEVRALDKEMRGWDTYINLEATVKNMLTSLRAVGELQNPAIRERHWNQLMKSTKSFFDTVLEFMKLEKVEIGGVKGRVLSAKIVAVVAEFSEHFGVFASKMYDALDPEDNRFPDDYEGFQVKIMDLDHRLAAVLCQAFDDCYNLESVFKLISIVGTVLDRPLIKDEFTSKYTAILEMLDEEIAICQELYDEQIEYMRKNGWMPVGVNMPPVAGALRWTYQLRTRISMPVNNFCSLDHPIVDSSEAKEVLKRYDSVIKQLDDLEDELFSDWSKTVPKSVEKHLKSCLLARAPNRDLILNFHP